MPKSSSILKYEYFTVGWR